MDAKNTNMSMKNKLLEHSSTKHTKIKPLHIVLIALAAVSIFLVCIFLGNYVAHPFNFGTTISNAYAYDKNDSRLVVIDNARQRLIFANENKQIINVREPSSTNGQLYCFNDVVLSNNAVYVHSSCNIKNTSFIEYEIIEKYDSNGKLLGKIWEAHYDLENNRTQSPLIGSMKFYDNQLYALLLSKDGATCSILSLQEYDNCIEMQNSLIKQDIPIPNDIDIKVTYSIPENKIIYFIDSNSKLNKYNVETSEITTVWDNVISCSKDLKLQDDGSIVQDNLEWLEGSFLSNTFLLQLRIIGFWLALFYLIALVLFLLIKGVIYLVKNKKADLLKRIAFASVIFIVLVSIVGVYSSLLKSNMDEESKQATKYANNIMYETNSENISSYLKECITTDYISTENRIALANTFEELSLIAAKNNYSVSYLLCYVKDQTISLAAASSWPIQSQETKQEDFLKSVESNQKEPLIGEQIFDWGKNYVVSQPVYDENHTLIGFFTTTHGVNSLNASSLFDVINLLIVLLVIAIVVSFIFLEAIDTVKMLIRKRKLKKNKSPQHEVCLARLLTFLIMLGSSSGSVIVSIVLKDMLEGTSFAGKDLFLAMPLFITSISYFMGNSVYMALSSRLHAKQYLILSSILSCFGFALCAYAVYNSIVILMFVGLFIANLFIEVPLLYSQSLPICVKNDSIRGKINRSCSTSAISAYSIATIIGGYLADIIGNYTIYIFALAIMIVLIIVIVIFIPHNSITDKKRSSIASHKKGKGSIAQYVPIITCPGILLLLLFANLPLELVGGYKSFLFPLFADGQGLSKSAISILVVLSSAVTFYLAPLLDKTESVFGSRNILLCGTLLLGLIFVITLFNQSMIWAIMLLIVSTVVSKVMQPSFMTLSQSIALEKNFDKKTTVSALNVSDCFFLTIRTPLLGALASFGNVIACVSVGIFCLISSFVMGIEKKRNKTTEHEEYKNNEKNAANQT